MDILKFINSNAVRNHLREINYEFSPVEFAFIVWQSEYCSMDEKIKLICSFGHLRQFNTTLINSSFLIIISLVSFGCFCCFTIIL